MTGAMKVSSLIPRTFIRKKDRRVLVMPKAAMALWRLELPGDK